ncbi:MAG: ExeM/NucH family extracellular endonuclease [Flavobacteriales bacterium]|nr:ExeM/NucH family extracellular endonuclease [Flavobacteriales bacterium]
MCSSLRFTSLALLHAILGVAQAQTPICAVQGAGTSSPYDGQTVTIQGIVTAVYTGSGSLGGYFLEQPDCDADANTSNGIFVYDPSPGGISIGQRVQVVGIVVEFNGVTEITPTSATVTGSGTVAPTEITLPLASYPAWEHYEGMYLRFPATLTVADNQGWVEYGQLTLAPELSLTPTQTIDPNDVVPSGTTSTGVSNVAAVNAAYALIDRNYVVLDDGRTNTYPTPLPWIGSDGTLRTGSTITDLRGVLHYSFGEYRMQPVGPVPIVHAQRPSVPAVEGTVRAASLNVLNYWTTLGEWGAQTNGELTRQRTKLLAALQALDADVYALHELENNDVAWADLLAALNAAVGAGTYACREENAFGSGGTKSVIFYRTAALSPLGALDALNGSPFQRPHLSQAFVVNATGGRFLFSTAHMRSKLCDNATGNNQDQGDGQGCFNSNRREQATALVSHWADLRASTGIEAHLIMGDFNSYGEEDPLDILRASGLQHLGSVEDHSYAYEGLFGALDHAWATSTLTGSITGAAVWNINSDEPEALDYADDNLSRYQPNAFRCSDHDPVLVGIDATELATGIGDQRTMSDEWFTLVNSRAQWTFPFSTVGQVEVYNARGGLVWRSMDRGTIVHDVTGWSSGLYLWRVDERVPDGIAAPAARGRFVVP